MFRKIVLVLVVLVCTFCVADSIKWLAGGQSQILAWWLAVTTLIVGGVGAAFCVALLLLPEPTKARYGTDVTKINAGGDAWFIHAMFADKKETLLVGACTMSSTTPCLNNEESSRIVAAFNRRRLMQDGDPFAETKLMTTALGTVLAVGLTEAQAEALQELVPHLWLSRPR
ncbi:MAG: hypothetical protein KBD55_00275 [Candidatus Pacebacteria bacterium]|jgi:hypothetical protein|nr:hypothetical protein [Candidatus Paceibacterota bacterium]